jgi:hypothetical protein
MSEQEILRVALARAHKKGDPDAIAEARRDYIARRLEDQIRAVVDGAPPIPLERRARLAALLLPGGDAA